ncbi:O-antigen ligase family protein [Radiobacillus sp. PE A8.2]|uniref:O-antigen ligase family protein n=1 Tax=Radiobacillus sp. PE A8.2 TaxID=3380349 RepID=UPI003890EA1F
MPSIKAPINYYVLLIFMTVYPFLVYPFWNIHYSTLIKLAYLIFFTVVMWAFFMLRFTKQKQLHLLFKTRGEHLVLLFLFLICLATIFSVDPMVSLLGSMDKLNGLIAWTCYLSFFMFGYHLIPKTKQIHIIQFLVYASVLVSIYGIIQHFFLEALVEEPVEQVFVKSWAFFDNPNHFGTYLVVMLLLALSLFLLKKSNVQLYIYAAIICVLFLALLYTGSRSGWLSFTPGVMLLTFFVVWKRRYLWKRWLLILASMFILMIVVDVTDHNMIRYQLFSIGSDVNSILLEEDAETAGSGRWGIWSKSIKIVKENYVLGTGPSTFSLVYPYEGDRNESTLDNSHNDFLEIAFSMGIPALLAYIALLYTIIRKGFITARRLDGEQEILLYGLIATIISYIIKTLFNISVVTIAPILWLLFGLCYAISRKK